MCKVQVVTEKDGSIVAKGRLKIKVTKDDILLGETGESSSCAIALAVRRATGDSADVSVGGSDISIGEYARAEGVQKALDRQLNRFVGEFDDLEGNPDSPERRASVKKSKIKPFTFVLDVSKTLEVKVPDLC
jgi:hypothetical protein